MMYLSADAKAYSYATRMQAKAQYRKKPLTDFLEVYYLYYFNRRGKIDHLNYNKLFDDCMNQIVWVDDSQVLVSHHYTLYDKENPRIELYIKPINNLDNIITASTRLEEIANESTKKNCYRKNKKT